MYGDWDRKHPFFLHLRLGRRHDLYPCHACSKDYLDLYISHMARVAIQQTTFGLSFGLKNGLRFHFESVTCLNYPFF